MYVIPIDNLFLLIILVMLVFPWLFSVNLRFFSIVFYHLFSLILAGLICFVFFREDASDRRLSLANIR